MKLLENKTYYVVLYTQSDLIKFMYYYNIVKLDDTSPAVDYLGRYQNKNNLEDKLPVMIKFNSSGMAHQNVTNGLTFKQFIEQNNNYYKEWLDNSVPLNVYLLPNKYPGIFNET